MKSDALENHTDCLTFDFPNPCDPHPVITLRVWTAGENQKIIIIIKHQKGQFFFPPKIKKRNERNMGGPAGTYRAHMFLVEGDLLLAALLVWHVAHVNQLLSHFQCPCFCRLVAIA